MRSVVDRNVVMRRMAVFIDNNSHYIPSGNRMNRRSVGLTLGNNVKHKMAVAKITVLCLRWITGRHERWR
jgi:hypothetical protein